MGKFTNSIQDQCFTCTLFLQFGFQDHNKRFVFAVTLQNETAYDCLTVVGVDDTTVTTRTDQADGDTETSPLLASEPMPRTQSLPAIDVVQRHLGTADKSHLGAVDERQLGAVDDRHLGMVADRPLGTADGASSTVTTGPTNQDFARSDALVKKINWVRIIDFRL